MMAFSDLNTRGFAVVPSVARGEVLDALRTVTDDQGPHADKRVGGLRSPLPSIPDLLEILLDTDVPALARSLFASDPFVVRSILFDKTPDANWLVPWHRDVTIAVARHVDDDRFGPWSIKDGVDHTRPPRAVLDAMVTVRLHLDDCPADNGALRVMPRSHTDDAIEPDEAVAVTCDVHAGRRRADQALHAARVSEVAPPETTARASHGFRGGRTSG